MLLLELRGCKELAAAAACCCCLMRCKRFDKDVDDEKVGGFRAVVVVVVALVILVSILIFLEGTTCVIHSIGRLYFYCRTNDNRHIYVRRTKRWTGARLAEHYLLIIDYLF